MVTLLAAILGGAIGSVSTLAGTIWLARWKTSVRLAVSVERWFGQVIAAAAPLEVRLRVAREALAAGDVERASEHLREYGAEARRFGSLAIGRNPIVEIRVHFADPEVLNLANETLVRMRATLVALRDSTDTTGPAFDLSAHLAREVAPVVNALSDCLSRRANLARRLREFGRHVGHVELLDGQRAGKPKTET